MNNVLQIYKNNPCTDQPSPHSVVGRKTPYGRHSMYSPKSHKRTIELKSTTTTFRGSEWLSPKMSKN